MEFTFPVSQFLHFAVPNLKNNTNLFYSCFASVFEFKSKVIRKLFLGCRNYSLNG